MEGYCAVHMKPVPASYRPTHNGTVTINPYVVRTGVASGTAPTPSVDSKVPVSQPATADPSRLAWHRKPSLTARDGASRGREGYPRDW